MAIPVQTLIRWDDTAEDAAVETLRAVERRVLWLATRMIHEANVIRPNPDKSKVGGHQASSASVVSILVQLYFNYLRAGDRVAVKPHASPAYHAVQYLLGNLERRYLTTLRQFEGLQAYPSRTKDPDPVDFSTGSVGLGAVAPIFAALTDRYAAHHFRQGRDERQRRFVALVGDAELDEGNVWEAVADEAVRSARLGNVMLIVDLNRQSLDRVIPGIRVVMLRQFFEAAGWQVIDVKYGKWLQTIFGKPGGGALRARIDEMENEEYQTLVRLPGAEVRERLIRDAAADQRVKLGQVLALVADDDVPHLLSDLGGHDHHALAAAFAAADRHTESPTVVFAYTIKGWGLPIAGDPLNHSALLNQAQVDTLRDQFGIDPADEWAGFAADSTEGALCAAARERLYPAGVSVRGAGKADGGASAAGVLNGALIPASLELPASGTISSQEAFGKTLVEMSRIEAVAPRIVTVSPDVSISTSLGGWINRVGVFSTETATPYSAETPQLLRWQPDPNGQHLELGISEMNLFLMLGQLGLSYELNGDFVIPIGTVYDPFVLRGLDALIYGLYSGSRFIFAGTPSGISLSPEGGAHQSTVTVSLGMELPNMLLYEPCFARETEWILLAAMRACCDREHGTSTYLRLSTKPIDQTLAEAALKRLGEAALREAVLRGGYRLLDAHVDLGVAADAPCVLVMSAGAMIPEAVAAAHELAEEGVAAHVFNLTGVDRLYGEWQAKRRAAVRGGQASADVAHLETLIVPAERSAPIVTVLDGASHALAFLGAAFGQVVVPLGVDRFSQSGARADLYAHEDIDAASIVNAALLGLQLAR